MPKAKDDTIDRVAKWFSHNRYTTVAVGVSLMLLSGCMLEPKAVSPVSGKNMTAEALLAEKEAELDRIRAEQERKAMLASSSMDAIRQRAESEIRAIAAANALDAKEAEANIRKLDSGYAVAGAEIEKEQGAWREAFELVKSSGLVDTIPMGSLIFGGVSTALAAGIGWDNRRKNTVIKKLKGEKPET